MILLINKPPIKKPCDKRELFTLAGAIKNILYNIFFFY